MEKGQTIMSHRAKMVTSLSIWFGTFSLGVSSGFIGPSLIEFSRKFETDIETVSKVFTIHQICFILGAFACGLIYNHVNRQLVSAILLMIMGTTTTILPLLPSLPIFFFVNIITAFTWAGYDTSQIVWMIELWEGDAAAFIQTQHFSFAAGAFFSPMIVRPFLPDDPRVQIDLLNGTSGTFETNQARNGTISNEITNGAPNGANGASLLHVPFLLGGIITFSSGLLILILYKIKKYEKPVSKRQQNENDSRYEDKRFENSKSRRRILLLILSALFLGFYVGLETAAFQFLATFSHFVDLRLSQRQAAGVLSTFVGAFTAGRGIGIAIVLRVPTQILLGGNFILILIGNYFLYFSNESSSALYAAALFLGLGCSTVFAGYFGFLERHMEVGNLEGSILIGAGGLICGIYPLIIGKSIEKSPFILLYSNIFSACCATIVFIIIWNVVNNRIGLKHNTEFDLDKDRACSIPILNHSD